MDEMRIGEYIATPFAAANVALVAACGHKIQTRPRIVKIDVETGEQQTYFELSDEQWVKTGALTRACWVDGSLLFMNTDTLFPAVLGRPETRPVTPPGQSV